MPPSSPMPKSPKAAIGEVQSAVAICLNSASADWDQDNRAGMALHLAAAIFNLGSLEAFEHVAAGAVSALPIEARVVVWSNGEVTQHGT